MQYQRIHSHNYLVRQARIWWEHSAPSFMVPPESPSWIDVSPYRDYGHVQISALLRASRILCPRALMSLMAFRFRPHRLTCIELSLKKTFRLTWRHLASHQPPLSLGPITLDYRGRARATIHSPRREYGYRNELSRQTSRGSSQGPPVRTGMVTVSHRTRRLGDDSLWHDIHYTCHNASMYLYDFQSFHY